MTDIHSTIEETVTLVLTGIINDRCVSLMTQFAASSDSADAFVKRLVSRKVESGERFEIVLSELMQILEGIADYSESIACIFMCYLWPIAGDQIGMHDECDSIDIWLKTTKDQKSQVI